MHDSSQGEERGVKHPLVCLNEFFKELSATVGKIAWERGTAPEPGEDLW